MPSIDINHELTTDNGIFLPLLSSSPATPPSGKAYVYAKTDNKVYIKNDAGTETELALRDDYTLTLGQQINVTTVSGFEPIFQISLEANSTYVITARLMIVANAATDAAKCVFGTLPSGSAVAQFLVPINNTSLRSVYHNTANDSTNQGTLTMDSGIVFLGDVTIVVNTGSTGTTNTPWTAIAIQAQSGLGSELIWIYRGSILHVIKI